MIDLDFNKFALQRLEEIEDEMSAPRPAACLDWRHDDYDRAGSYWEKLKNEKEILIYILGKDKPYKYLSSKERFVKYGKSPMMLAQEAAAKALLQDE